MQHSKEKRWNLKHKITASLLALTVVGSGAVPLLSTAANAATADDETVGAGMSAAVGTSNGTDVFWTPATYFDYLSDQEINSNQWRNVVKAGTGYNGSKDEWYPYWMYNDKIKAYANANSSWSKPLYFGNFCNTHGAYDTSAHHEGADKSTVWNMMTTQNATRFSYSANNSNGVYDHHTSYQGLVSNTLINNQLYAANGTTKMPYFDENFDYTKVIKSSFPFRQVEHQAVGEQKAYTEYFFDSTDAKDNVYFEWDNNTPTTVNYGAGTNYGVNDGLKYFMADTNSGYGIFPFNKKGDGKNLDYGFGIRMDMKFRVPAGGVLPNGEDVKFNFSGDDDLWMFITDKNGNSQLVLDMGGNHKMSTGTVNFKTKTATVDRVHDNSSSCKDIWAVEWSGWNSLVLYAWGNGHEGQFYYCDTSADKNGSEYRFRADAKGSKGTPLKEMSNFLVAKNESMNDGEKTGDLSISGFQGKKFWTDNPDGKIDGPIKNNEKSVTTSFDFEATDAQGNYNDYTMTVFYMERGMLESNCQMSFTMIPLGNDYIVEEEIQDTNVNPGLRDDVKAVTKFDFVPKENDKQLNKLSYTVIDKDGNETRVTGDASNKFSLGSGDAAHFTNFFNTGNNMQVTQYNAEDSILKYDSHWVYKSDVHGDQQPETSGGTDLLDENGEGTGNRKLIDPKSNQNYDFAQLHAKYVNVPKVSNIAVTKKAVGFDGQPLKKGDLYEDDTFTAQVQINLEKDGNFKSYDLSYDTESKSSYTAEELAALPVAENGVVTIKNGQTIYFPGIPEGATFKVDETGVNPDHFDVDSIAVSPETGTVGDTANVTITNPRIPPEGEVDLSITKEFIVGSVIVESSMSPKGKVELKKDDFEFSLEGSGIATQKKTNGSDGTVKFDTLKFTLDPDKADGTTLVLTKDEALAGKNFTFTVKETDTKKPDVAYDTSPRNIVVNVKYDAATNKLVPDITEGSDVVVSNELRTGGISVTKQVVDEKGDPVFDCPDTFKATVKVSYNGGRTFISAPFYYVDELNQARQLGTEDGTNFTWDNIQDGSMLFIENLPFGTVVTVTEEAKTGYRLPDPIVLTVGEEKDGDYIMYPEATLVNWQKPENSTEIIVNKSFSEVAEKANLSNSSAFDFTLEPQGNAPVPENATLEDGKVTATLAKGATAVSFGMIKFDPKTVDYSGNGKTYTYKVKEVDSGVANVIYDDREFTVTVKVKENAATGELDVTQTYKAGNASAENITFTNDYETGKISVLKSLIDFDGQKMTKYQNTAFNMSATVTYPNGAAETKTVTVKADGNKVTVVDGAPIGTTVSLFETDSKGLISDAVRENPKTATITANDKDITITVTNVRKVPEPVQTVVKANKIFKGDRLQDKEFTFTLTGDGNDNNNVSLKAQNDAEGNITFAPIQFSFGSSGGAIIPLNKDDFKNTNTKDYFFTLKEENPNRNDVDYDTTEYTVKVTVTVDDQLSKLSVSVPEVVSVETSFVNSKRGSATVTKLVKQMVDGEEKDFSTDTKFDIDVTIKEPQKEAKTETITLGANETKTYTNLPIGTKIAINETDAKGFTVSYPTQEDEVKLNETDNTITDAAVVVKNMRPTPGQTQAAPAVVKNLKGDTLTDGQFRFKIKGDGFAADGVNVENEGANVTFPAITYQYTEGEEHIDTDKHIVYVKNFDNNNQRVFTYAITEDSTFNHDSKTQYDGKTITATVTVTKSGTDTVTLANAVTYANNDSTFNNVKLSDVSISKKVQRTNDAGQVVDIKTTDDDYNKLANQEFTVKTYVKYPGKDYESLPLTTSKGQMTEVDDGVYGFTIKHNETVTISDLPVGTKVKFEETEDSNYKTDSKEITVGKDASDNVSTLTNILQAPGKGYASVNKAFTPNAILAGLNQTTDNTYNFNLAYTGNIPTFRYDENVSINGAENNWSANFPAITFPADLDYTKGIDFTFLMKETDATTTDSNIVVDTDTFTLTYTVTQENGALKVTGPEIMKNGTEKAESATFYNGYRLGDVQVVKAFEDYDGTAIADSVVANMVFPVTLTATYANGETKSFTDTIGLNKTAEVKDLPRGTKVIVTETDTKGMTLKSIVPADPVTIGEEVQVVTVTNKRTTLTDTEVTIGARKFLEGSDITKNAPFNFSLTGEYKGQKINLTAQNDGNVVTFAPIKYTLDESKKGAENTIYLAKTDFENDKVKMQFTVTEVPDNRVNVKFDSNLTRTVNVEITRTETETEVKLSGGAVDAMAPEFTNTKLGKVGFTKTVTDYDGQSSNPDIDFIFKAEKKVGDDWDVINNNIVINLSKGNDTFETGYLPVGTEVRFTETDNKGFIAEDPKVVTVEDQDLTKFTTFSNIHPEAQGAEVTVTAKKILEGATLKDGEFRFSLTGTVFGTEINQEKTNAEGGSIKFDAIKFSLEKEEEGAIKLTKAMFANSKTLNFELTVTEINPNRADIQLPASTAQTVKGTVTLTEDGSDAHLTAALTENANPEFTNIQLGRVGFTKIAKDINGAAFKPDADFIFKAEKKVGDNWDVINNNIVINLSKGVDSYVTEYLPVGTEVKFTETDDAGFENSVKEQTVTVALEDASKTVPYATVSFTNNRPVPGTVKATLTAEKVLNGAKLGDGDFSFFISGEGADANTEYKNEGKNITFDEITYKYSKNDSDKTSGSTVVLHDSDFTNGKAVREYTITEKNTELPDVIYAANTVKGVVTITKTETASNITLTADVTYPDGKTFTNEIKKGSVKIVKTNQAGEKVDDVTFKLFKVTGNDLDRETVLNSTLVDKKTTENGEAEFEKLDLYVDEYQNINNPTYQWYCLAETDPGKDYNLNSGLTFFQVPTANVYDLTFEYMNGKVITPTSGGTGMGMFTTVGCGLLGFGGLAFAGYMLFVRKSNKKRAQYRAK